MDQQHLMLYLVKVDLEKFWLLYTVFCISYTAKPLRSVA